jgi:hypothetical protein
MAHDENNKSIFCTQEFSCIFSLMSSQLGWNSSKTVYKHHEKKVNDFEIYRRFHRWYRWKNLNDRTTPVVGAIIVVEKDGNDKNDENDENDTRYILK